MSPAEVVVIGSGPCGAVAAAELVLRDISVTVLEAGPRPVRGIVVRAAGNTVVRWAEQSGLRNGGHRPLADPSTRWYSSISVGGLSNYWTAAVPRMAPQDFFEGAAVDERYRWPVTYDELEPYYSLVEKAMRVTAGEPIHGVPANVVTYHRHLPHDWSQLVGMASAAGHGIGVIPLAIGSPWLLAARPSPWTSYHCILEPLRRNPHLRLLRNAAASRLVWSPSMGRVTEVEYVDRVTKEVRRLACRAVVVAGGTLNTTRLLLRSRSADFPDGLGNTEHLVGRFLHDHPREWWPADLDRPMQLLAHPIYIARAAVGAGPPLMASSLTIGLASPAARIGSWFHRSTDRVGVQVLGTMVPTEEHFVRLATQEASLDPFDDVLEVSISYDDSTRQNMVRARERFSAVMASGGVRVKSTGPFDELVPGSSVHYSGTVRMHADRRLGVLDAWNRVHDVPNVAVCDMSAFTTGPEKNPTLTAMALAVRAADRLATDLRAGTAF